MSGEGMDKLGFLVTNIHVKEWYMYYFNKNKWKKKYKSG